MSKYVYLNSVNRDITSVSGSNCVWRLNNPLKSASTLSLVEARLPQTTYNINSRNDTIDMTHNGNPFSATLTQGFYASGTDLATEIDTALTAEAGAWTVTYDATTCHYTISETTPLNFSLLFSTGANQTQSDLWRVMGFTDSTGRLPADTMSGAATTSNAAGVLYPNTTVFVTLTFNGQRVGSTQVPPGQECSFILPSIAGYADTFQSTKQEFDYVFQTPTNEALSTIGITLQDRFGRDLELNNGEFTFTFKILSA